ncbi:MAG TPA: chemotaxis protein CheD [Marinagarivorans sp.]
MKQRTPHWSGCQYPLGGNRYFLNTGDVTVSERAITLQTILGSCVSVTAYHSERRAGGMCHYLLPKVPATPNHRLLKPGFYGWSALELLQQQLMAMANLSAYRFSVFGGASTVHTTDGRLGVGQQNLAVAHQWAQQNNLHFTEDHTGGSCCRTLLFDLRSGQLALRTIAMEKGGLL